MKSWWNFETQVSNSELSLYLNYVMLPLYSTLTHRGEFSSASWPTQTPDVPTWPPWASSTPGVGQVQVQTFQSGRRGGGAPDSRWARCRGTRSGSEWSRSCGSKRGWRHSQNSSCVCSVGNWLNLVKISGSNRLLDLFYATFSKNLSRDEKLNSISRKNY